MDKLTGLIKRVRNALSENDGGITAPVARRVPPGREPDGTQAARGLSSCHISPQIIAYAGASYLKVQTGKRKLRKMQEDDEKKVQVKRGRISEFSKKSRLRLIREFSKLRQDAPGVLVTLTYPGEYSDKPEDWKRDLDVFLKRWRRAYPQISGIWKLEPQKRGAPHFHLLAWNVDYAALRLFVGQMWYEVVGSGDEKHLQAGTRVEQVKTYRGTMFYASKYLGKAIPAEWGNAGRFWGVFGREYLPYGELVTEEISEKQAYQMIRYMRRKARIRGLAFKSLTISVGDVGQWFRLAGCPPPPSAEPPRQAISARPPNSPVKGNVAPHLTPAPNYTAVP